MVFDIQIIIKKNIDLLLTKQMQLKKIKFTNEI